MYNHVAAGMCVTFYAHFAVLNLDNLPDFVLGFGYECESHFLPFVDALSGGNGLIAETIHKPTS
jgi:hypothetical protein